MLLYEFWPFKSINSIRQNMHKMIQYIKIQQRSVYMVSVKGNTPIKKHLIKYNGSILVRCSCFYILLVSYQTMVIDFLALNLFEAESDHKHILNSVLA